MTKKYKRQLKGVEFDVYDVLHAFKVTNPALQHAIKKLLMPGERGAKDAAQDLKEAIQAVERAIEMIEPEVNEKAHVEDFLQTYNNDKKAPDEIKYPCYMRSKYSGNVVKFESLNQGNVVKSDDLSLINDYVSFWEMSNFYAYTPTPEDNLPEL